MIPKIIHYCWFGRNPLPKSAIKCINSWKKFLPDYEIKEWNEDNFDVNIIPYTSEAYSVKKYAFVSDYARFWILYNYGGLYFDTDVEVIRSFEDILTKGSFMGVEGINTIGLVNPGLGIGAKKGMTIYKELLDYYASMSYLLPNGKIQEGTIVTHTTNVLQRHGLVLSNNDIQNCEGIIIYPPEYFNPYDYTMDKLRITKNTHSIHWYTNSWASGFALLRLKIGTFVRKYIYHKH